MKTFKQFGATIRGVTITCIFTLHHISFGLYWSAPAFEKKRLVTLSIHLPFFMATVSFVVRDRAKRPHCRARCFKVRSAQDKCPHCQARQVDNPQLGCWRFQCKCYEIEEWEFRRNGV